MMQLRAHSFNVANRMSKALPYIRELMRRSEVLFLQDIGNEDPNGPACLRYGLRQCTILVNMCKTNRSRSVALVVKNSIRILGNVVRNDRGNLISARLGRGNFEFLAVSVYLPPKLDVFGFSTITLTPNDALTEAQKSQLLAQETYDELYRLTRDEKFYIIGGDFNETLDQIGPGVEEW